MPILIDGYNLLHAANIVAEGPGVYSLEKSRRALLDFLVSVIDPAERTTTTIVFDGREAPPGLPRQASHAEMKILFSAPGCEADDLIEELLPTYSAARSVTVVSSDHRVQRAAKRRRANAIDSDVWTRERIALRRKRNRRADQDRSADQEPLTENDVAMWVAEFGRLPSLAPEALTEGAEPPSESESSSESSSESDDDSDAGPFPPGYAEDVWREEAGGESPFPEGYGEDLL